MKKIMIFLLIVYLIILVGIFIYIDFSNYQHVFKLNDLTGVNDVLKFIANIIVFVFAIFIYVYSILLVLFYYVFFGLKFLIYIPNIIARTYYMARFNKKYKNNAKIEYNIKNIIKKETCICIDNTDFVFRIFTSEHKNILFLNKIKEEDVLAIKETPIYLFNINNIINKMEDEIVVKFTL